jgi:hypothetical protein
MAFVSTYYGTSSPKQVELGEVPEYGEPLVPVVVRFSDCLRIVLGTRNHDDPCKPDLWIERHPSGWMIALHSQGAGDPTGIVYFHDDGRAFLRPDSVYGEQVEILDFDDGVPGFEPVE